MTQLLGADWKKDLENATLTTAPASDVQALAKTADDVAVTPANLAALGSTATFAGLVELATNAEAITGTDTARAVTPAGVSAVFGKLWLAGFSGSNGAGACTLTGVSVGDAVLSVFNLADSEGSSSTFESAITVEDQIQQTAAGNLSSVNFLALILGKS